MRYLFPEIEVHNKQTLYIIGNGFDLASGMPTSYTHFYKWLESNKCYRLISMMEIFFSNQRDVWSDIEKALGEYDENQILEYCKPEEDFDYDHSMRYMASVEDSPDWLFQPILHDFINSFRDWVNSIDITTAKRIRTLPAESLYLTFNYTETLERVYSIPKSNILHIHGCRLLDEQCIIGHNNYRNPNDAYNDEYEMPYIQDTWNKIIGWMNGLFKDTTAIIDKNQCFFEKLSNIECVIVYGHSLNEVDLPYMKEIVRHIGIEKQWYISQYNTEDSRKIDAFIRKLGLKNTEAFWVKPQPCHIEGSLII